MKTLIFDFDGTIADSFATLVGIFEDITGRPKKLTLNEIEKLRGSSLRQILKYLGIKKWQLPKLLLKGKRQMALRMDDIKPFDSLPATLNKLHNEKFQMYILSTNSSSNIDRFLKANKLQNCFIEVYGDIGLRGKAKALKKLIKKRKIDIANCVYIGDEVRDVEAAQKAKLRCVAVGWGFNHPEALKLSQPNELANSPQALLKILKKLD